MRCARPTVWLRIGAPASLTVLTALHPGYQTDAAVEYQRIRSFSPWIPLHLALLVAFEAFAVSLLVWPRAGTVTWRVRQVGAAAALVFYSAFIGVDGIAGGVLAHSITVRSLLPGAQVGLSELFASGTVEALALIGAAGWLLAATAIVVDLVTADQHAVLPGGLLIAGVVLLGTSHAPPFGPAGSALATAGAALVQSPARRARSQGRNRFG